MGKFRFRPTRQLVASASPKTPKPQQVAAGGVGTNEHVWPFVPPHPEHRGAPVQVGPYVIYVGGTRYLTAADLEKFDLLVPLTESVPYGFGKKYQVLAAPLQDYGGVPAEWREFLESKLIPELAAGKKILTFCVGSHGRTGTMLGSLISLLETSTADPIAAARERHCHKAVETLAQVQAIFALRGEEVPKKYKNEFTPQGIGFAGGIYSQKNHPWGNWGW